MGANEETRKIAKERRKGKRKGGGGQGEMKGERRRMKRGGKGREGRMKKGGKGKQTRNSIRNERRREDSLYFRKARNLMNFR